MNRKEATELVAKQNISNADTTLLISRRNNRGYYVPTAVVIDPKTHQTWFIVRAVYITSKGEVQSYGNDGKLLAANTNDSGWTLAELCDHRARNAYAEQARLVRIKEVLGVEALDSPEVHEAKRRLARQVLEILGLEDDTTATFNEYGDSGMEIKLSLAQVRILVGLS